MNTKDFVQEARWAVASASCSPKKLVAIHTGVTALAGLVVALMAYLLEAGIGDAGGLSGISTRAWLETAQSVLDLALSVLTPFWILGFTAAALRMARMQQAHTGTLLDGFRRWGPVLRMMIAEGVLYFALSFMIIQTGTFVYMMTPLSQPMQAMLQELMDAGTMDATAVAELLMSMELSQLLPIFWSMVPFVVIPTAVILIFVRYRLRLAQFIIMDQPRVGALYALLMSNRLMKGNCFRLFLLDLRFWWFYGLELVIQILCYGDLLLPLLGMQFGISEVMAAFLFYLLALVAQLGLYVWQKPQIFTAYALFYEHLLPKESTAEM